MKNLISIILLVMLFGCASQQIDTHRYRVSNTLEDYSEWQDSILSLYVRSKDEPTKTRHAFCLSRLWFKGLLNNEAKDYLIDHYYRIHLIEYSDKPELHLWLWAEQSFPFPSTTMELTITRYHNGIQSVRKYTSTMNLSANNLSILYQYIARTGVKNGDKIYYEVIIVEKRDSKTIWQKKLRSNEIVVQCFK